MVQKIEVPVVIVGAGPSGSVAATLLKRRGHDVLVVEREQFPRFSIGESLLPQSMTYLEEAGMLRACMEGCFQPKNGAAFLHGKRYATFDFREKTSPGWGTTWQVQRAYFDKVLADCAESQGVQIRYRHTVDSITPRESVTGGMNRLTVRDENGEPYEILAKTILDASGFGRVLPRLLNLEQPSDFPVRTAVFTHIQDNIASAAFDRQKILVTIHPQHVDVWYWLIPFSNGRSSIGVVAEKTFLDGLGTDDMHRLRTLVSEADGLNELLERANWDTPVRHIGGYAANVKSLYGPGFALLGNAGEFLDPVFSSGVTIAVKSASMAADLVDRQLRGETVDWENEFSRPLRRGVDTFRVFVRRWYDGTLQSIFFHPNQDPLVRKMICSILAGYAWDEENPYVQATDRRLQVLHELTSP